MSTIYQSFVLAYLLKKIDLFLVIFSEKIGKPLDKRRFDVYNVIRLAEANSKIRYIMEIIMTLLNAEEGREYTILSIETNDEELDSFLFSLGCYSGEPITVVTRRKHGCVVSIKDGRYNIDNDLADAISVE